MARRLRASDAIALFREPGEACADCAVAIHRAEQELDAHVSAEYQRLDELIESAARRRGRPAGVVPAAPPAEDAEPPAWLEPAEFAREAARRMRYFSQHSGTATRFTAFSAVMHAFREMMAGQADPGQGATEWVIDLVLEAAQSHAKPMPHKDPTFELPPAKSGRITTAEFYGAVGWPAELPQPARDWAAIFDKIAPGLEGTSLDGGQAS